MLRIGIVGAENSHTAAIAKTLNVVKAIPDVSVVSVWGETEAYAAKAADVGKIPAIVKNPADMIGHIDAVVTDHRHPQYHLPAMQPFLAARIPMFVDKPFCYRLAEGVDFLARARQAGVPVTSFSTVPLQAAFTTYRKLLAGTKVYGLSSIGPCDIHSQYGNIFFYGIHQIDSLIELGGLDVEAVHVTEFTPKHAVAELYWKSGLMAAMQCLEGWDTGFQFAATTSIGPLGIKSVDDADPYLAGMKLFVEMFKTGKEPVSHQRILTPIAVLEALEKSVVSGKVEPIARV
jgi:predicted dehydrogenase